MRVVGIVAPFSPRGVSIREKIRFIELQGENGHRRPVPGAPSSGTPRKSQAKFRAGTVCGLWKGPVGTGPVGSVFGGKSFYRETRGTTLEYGMVGLLCRVGGTS